MKKLVLFLCIIFLILGCASQRFTKKGAKFEEAGLYENAANNYYEAAKRKNSNVDAKLGLRKTGQITLDKKLSDFYDVYKQGNYDKAVHDFVKAEDYFYKVKSVGVNLTFPEQYRTYYEESKSDYLGKKYIEGLEKLNNEEFANALSIFKEIRKIDDNYKDVKAQFIIARYEPIYREAMQYFETDYYRKAYFKFENIINGTGDYKESRTFKDEAQEKATITILVSNFSSPSQYGSTKASTITANIKEKISNSENPFLKLIDASKLNSNLFEDGEINMQVANLTGIDAIISGNLIEYNKKTGARKETTKRGYLKEVTKIKNSEGKEIDKVIYHKTKYSEFYAKNSASINLNYEMISTETNEVLFSGNFNEEKSDEVHYAVYEGNKKKLVPGYWKYKKGESKEDKIKNNTKDIGKLIRLLEADQKIKSSDKLLEKLLSDGVASMASKVEYYNPEK